MNYRKITAIIATERLEAVERALQSMQVDGISVSQVHGYGEYRNFYRSDLMTRYARIEIFCPAFRAQDIARSIVNVAHTGLSGDGIVAVSPVEHLFCIRTKAEVPDNGHC